MLTKSPSHAQFNTIGYVKKHSISKKKSPQETTHVASVDSVVKADSLPPDFSQDVLPYLRASFPLKNIQINSRFGMRNHPVKHKTIMHNGVDLAAHYEKVFSMFPGEVTGVGHDNRSGKYVTVRTAGYTISYCHLTAENGLCFTPHGDMVYIPSAIAIFLLSGSQRGCSSMQERCLGYLEVPACQLAPICT